MASKKNIQKVLNSLQYEVRERDSVHSNFAFYYQQIEARAIEIYGEQVISGYANGARVTKEQDRDFSIYLNATRAYYEKKAAEYEKNDPYNALKGCKVAAILYGLAHDLADKYLD